MHPVFWKRPVRSERSPKIFFPRSKFFSRIGGMCVNSQGRMQKRVFGLLLSGVLLFTAGARTSVSAENSAADSPKSYSSSSEPVEIGIDEQQGEFVPLDLAFRDEDGDTVLLKDLITKPTLLGLVYYECPGICIPFLGGFAHVIDLTPSVPGEDYQVLTVSFDPSETPEIAAEKKKDLIESMKKRKIEPTAWRFLTGDTDAIKALTNAVGFRYREEGTDYLHSSAAIVLSPDGKIIRYMYGLDYLPLDLQLALIEAKEGRVGPTIVKALRYCFNYDPEGRRYVFDVTKVAGAAISLGGFTLLGTLIITGRKKKKLEDSEMEPEE